MKELKKYTISITPSDTLFFRRGFPFSIGEETWIETGVFPNPSVIWGSLFSTMLADKHIRIKDKSSLIINGIFLHKKEEHAAKILISAPLDIFYKKDKKDSYKGIYKEAKNIISNYPTYLPYLTKPNIEEKVENTANCFIDWIDFTENYPKQNGATRIYNADYFTAIISKVGITRSNTTRTSEEGKLYRMDMNEYKNGWSIIVEFEAPNFTSEGILKLGGEGKTAKYQLIPQLIEKPIIKDTEDSFFKLYFQTPAFFESGNGLLELSKLKHAQLISASIGKPISIGGFDMEKKQPKVMKKAVPAGSIYLFEGNPFKSNEEIKILLDGEDRKKGFGIYHLIN